jgi:transcriptional regulator with XRE-family HTH domain
MQRELFKKRERGKKNMKRGVSAANLPEELTIQNPKDYIHEMRTTFLRKQRERASLTRESVAEKCGIDVGILKRIESGVVDEQDMIVLNSLAEIYGVDYSHLLFLFKLAQRPEHWKIDKLAAYHDQRIDEETEKELIGFLEKLKDDI